MSTIANFAAAVAICVLCLFLMVTGRRAERAERQRDDLADRIRKTCVAGAGMLAVAEHKLDHGDEGAEEAAKDLLAYGLPWLDLCSTRRVDPLPDDLSGEIHALYVDIDRWRSEEP